MHYSAQAFSKYRDNPEKMTIIPKQDFNPFELGRQINLSQTDITKIKKMYKCPPYDKW